MRDFIIKTIGMIGVSFIVKEIYIDSFLSYLRLDFVNKYGKYCIFDVFYNETDFFSETLVLIGKGREVSLSDSLRTRIKVIGDFKDYKNYKYSVPTKESLDKIFSDKMEELTCELCSIKVENFSIRNVEFYSSPTLMLFIHFNYKGRRQRPMKIFIGEEISYKSDLDLELLINNIKEVLTNLWIKKEQ